MYNIHLLPASFGDSILIEYGDEKDLKYILIDGGPFFAFDGIYEALKTLAPNIKELELVVATHIDIDHIDGIISLLNRDRLPVAIKEIWFNGWDEIASYLSGELGGTQGEYLGALIKRHNIPHNTSFGGKAVVVTDYNKLPTVTLDGGMHITLLNPGPKALHRLAVEWDKTTKDFTESEIAKMLNDDKRYDRDLPDDVWLLGEDNIEVLQEERCVADNSPANGSCIAFIATYDGKKCFFAGDADTDGILAAIEPMTDAAGVARLKVDAWKLAHHGSKRTTLDCLMQKIDCKTVLISSDGKRYKHPDQACIAKLLKHNGPGLRLYFNYRTAFNDMWDDEIKRGKYNYQTTYPAAGKNGISFSLG